MSNLEIYRHRGALTRTKEAIKNGQVVVGFIGGSITDGRSGHNWPEPVMRWLVERFPEVRFVEENAAIGATGSDLAVFRAQRDMIERNCDLVFVEFAVNDRDVEREQRGRSREGLIRKLLEGEGRDLVLAYTYCQPMYEEMISGQVPESVGQFEMLAENYGIGSVWMGLHALEEIKAGRMRWEEWLPDRLHPRLRGSLSYGQSVIEFLKQELLESRGTASAAMGDTLPEPVFPKHWAGARILPFSEVQLTGPWRVRRSPSIVWMDQVLETSAVGAGLAFDFEGRGLVLGFDFGKTSSEFRYRIDGGEWAVSRRERPEWCGDEGWYRTFIVGDDWGFGQHHIEMEVVHGNQPDCWGTTFRLALIGVL